MRLLFKNAYIKVKKSLGRFFSLVMIVFLGTGFFVGIRSSSPDIVDSVDKYYDQNNLMDFKIVSTLGLTNEDVNSLEALSHSQLVVPSFSLDVVSKGEAVRVHAIEQQINEIALVEGRMPENNRECLGDNNYYNVGDEVEISSNVNDKLKNSTYKVVGTIKSVLYTLKDYGISSAGDGKLSSFIFIPKDNFTIDYFTEIYITAKDTKESKTYSQDYNENYQFLEKELLQIKPIQESKRYEEVLEKATSELFKSENDLSTIKKDGKDKLDKAKKDLDYHKSKLKDAKNNVEKKFVELEKSVVDKKMEFDSAKKEIASAWELINVNLAKNTIGINEVDAKTTELKNNLDIMNNNLNSLIPGSPEYIDLSDQIANYTNSYQEMLKLQSSIITLKEKETALNNGIETFDTEIAKARESIVKGREEITQNEKTLSSSYEEYQKNLDEFNKIISDGEAKIAKAKEDIKKIKKPEWLLLDRNDNAGYLDLKDDTTKVSMIASIFPLFFLLIVALMSLNTMARMIEEERGELGTLASLGFSNARIILIYIIYVLVATFLGVASGFYVGSESIPRIIYSVYTSNYNLPIFIVGYDILMLINILVVSVILMCSVTIITCMNELKNKPAYLMRPVSPKKGKKIYLENVSYIWSRLSFTWKVTIRNMFRYKKRVLMTIIGIAGCTALLLTGFGIRDSVDRIAKIQYSEIFKYDDLIVLNKDISILDNDFATILSKEKIVDPTLIYQTSFTFELNGEEIETYMVVPENETQFSKYFALNSKESGEIAILPNNGVVITQKIASLLKIKIGQSIKIRDINNMPYIFKVTDIVENYTFHYIYMNKALYTETFVKPILYNMIVSDNEANNNSELAKSLIDSGKIAYVNFSSDNLNTFNDLVSGLNSIIYLIIIISSLLVLIVLYNLTTINISERKREIATLKVLGFYDNEVNEYIYRESFILTLFGIIAGLIAGILLHQIVIRMVETDNTVFIKVIRELSYVYTSLITIVLAVIIQTATYFKLKKINMIESLKSVE